MSLSIEYLRVYPLCGDSVEDCIRECKEMTISILAPVACSFNGVELYVTADITEKELLEFYQSEIKEPEMNHVRMTFKQRLSSSYSVDADKERILSIQTVNGVHIYKIKDLTHAEKLYFLNHKREVQAEELIELNKEYFGVEE